MTHLLAWPVRPHPTDPARKPTKITEPLCALPDAWPAKSFRFFAFSGDIQDPPNAAEWGKCQLAARCIVVETLKAVQFTNGSQDNMELFDLPQVVGILTAKMLGYMAALVLRVRRAMVSYQMLDRLIVYQRAYEHLILLCKTNAEARIQVLGDFYPEDVVQIWTRCFADMLETCPASCVSFLCDFVLRNELNSLRDFSAVCLSAVLVKHPHWYATNIITREFSSCYDRQELTQEDLKRMSEHMADLVRNPPSTPEPETPEAAESAHPATPEQADEQKKDESPDQEAREEEAAPHVDSLLSLCLSRGCPCIRARTDIVADLAKDSPKPDKRAATEKKIRDALTNPVAKMLPFSVVSAVFPVSFLDEDVWTSIKGVSVLGEPVAFEEKPSECRLVDGECANWKTLAGALGMKD